MRERQRRRLPAPPACLFTCLESSRRTLPALPQPRVPPQLGRLRAREVERLGDAFRQRPARTRTRGDPSGRAPPPLAPGGAGRPRAAFAGTRCVGRGSMSILNFPHAVKGLAAQHGILPEAVVVASRAAAGHRCPPSGPRTARTAHPRALQLLAQHVLQGRLQLLGGACREASSGARRSSRRMGSLLVRPPSYVSKPASASTRRDHWSVLSKLDSLLTRYLDSMR